MVLEKLDALPGLEKIDGGRQDMAVSCQVANNFKQKGQFQTELEPYVF